MPTGYTNVKHIACLLGEPREGQTKDWALLLQANSSIDPASTLTEQHMASDSVHLYMFDLIHLIGTNFIQAAPNSTCRSLRKRNQQILLEKIIQKLTATVQPAAAAVASGEQLTEQIQRHLATNSSRSNLREEGNAAASNQQPGDGKSLLVFRILNLLLLNIGM